jgi:hypothetical protein
VCVCCCVCVVCMCACNVYCVGVVVPFCVCGRLIDGVILIVNAALFNGNDVC